ncbi:unnamed protein product [Nippostrongylus brasiliensis]|uniref:Lipase_3 domain-containing protein n=1 Tax=Nippostrongylus brasiliensis TaxID=27835 RepID=A0A0N4XYY4_NIPBR|nr:unnamed protein product [Nippostrongylus brasiliensis]
MSNSQCLKLSLNCPRLPDPAYAYNETFVRYYMTPVMAGVFPKTPEKCLKSQLPYVSFYKIVNVKCAAEMLDSDIHCHGYTAWDPVEKAVIIAFRGTSTGMQMTDEIMSFFRHKVQFFDNGYLFKYFHDAFFFLWNGGLEQQVRTLKYQYPDYKVYVTGHSLGAAIAAITASYLVKWNMWTPETVRLVTYNNNMTVGEPYQLCQEADGEYCSDTVISTRGADHMFYFKDLDTWPSQGCPWCTDSGTCMPTSSGCKIPITLSLNCPRLPDPAYAYNETFVRYYMTPVMAGVFPKTPDRCLRSQLPYVSVYKTIDVKCAAEVPDINCHAYTAWDPVEKAVIIAFRGTDGGLQMTDEIMSFFRHKVQFFDDGYLFKYFHDAFFFLWNGGLEQQVRTLKYQYPDYKVYVTGHSLGAAIAAITASYLVKWNMWTPETVRLVTYNNNMTVGEPYQLCQEADGEYCSDTVISTRGADHMYYFKDLDTWPAQGCP